MADTPLNVAAHLARMAAEFPGRPAIHVPRRRVKVEGVSEHRSITFDDLNADADAIAHGLLSIGVVRGMPTVLMVPPSLDFFAVTFALFKVAAVPVLIDPGMGIRNLGRCLAEAGPQAFIGIPKAHAARRALGWGKNTIRTTVNVARWRFFCSSSLAALRETGRKKGLFAIPDVARDEPAAILFTSGSTGVAKGAVYTHGNFAAQVEMLKSTYGIEPGEIDLCTFPLFALFGPALGMTCVIPDMNPTRPAQIDPRKALAQIRQFGVTNMFGSPAVIRRLGEWGEDSSPNPLPQGERGLVSPPSLPGKGVGGLGLPEDPSPNPLPQGERGLVSPPSLPGKGVGGLGPSLATLRRVISAGAPASAASIERFVKLLPESVQVFTPYGATEALPVANIGSQEILGETRHLTEQGKGVCVGRPVAGMKVVVIPITDEPIPEWDEALRLPDGEIGEFVVRGAVVTKRYHNRPDATKLAKIRDTRTGEVLHRMGDVGYIDDRGRLWFCGRKSHRVVTPHGTLFTDMVEPIFNTLPNVRRSALVGVAREGITYPVLCLEFEPGHFPVQYIATEQFQNQLSELRERQPLAKTPVALLRHPCFPVDIRHNSKIFREKLAVWADKQLGKDWKPEGAA